MNDSQNVSFIKICSIFGMLGPCIFLIVITILDYLWSEYDGFYSVFSALGAENSPYAIYMNIFGFGIFGTSIIFLGFGLFKSIKKHVLVSIGIFLFISSGILIILLIFFPCDPGCLHATISGQLHKIFTYTASVFMPISFIILIYPLKLDKKWNLAWLYFPIELIIFLIVTIPLAIILTDRGAVGLFQRISMCVILIWMIIMSIQLFIIGSKENI